MLSSENIFFDIFKRSFSRNCLLYLFLLFLMFESIDSKSQVLTSQGGKIHDYANYAHADSFKITVKQDFLKHKLNDKYGLTRVCFFIDHKRVSDLKVSLVSPDGSMIWLTNRNGGLDGRNYENTCFRSIGFNGFIHTGTAPFQGEYTPDGRFNFINNGQSGEGDWYLLVEDLRKDIEGDLYFINLEFGDNPNADDAISPCDFNNAGGCICVNKEDSCELLPDLVILPFFTEHQWEYFKSTNKDYPNQLRLAISIANVGDGPFETVGSGNWYCGDSIVPFGTICPDKQQARQNLVQRIYVKTSTNDSLKYKDIICGTNYFDANPGHNHYHVDNWVVFNIKKEIKVRGKVSYKLVAKGNKISYCLWDTGICNENGDVCKIGNIKYSNNNLPNYGLGGYKGCNSGMQGISVGGYDTYGMLYEGQSIELSNDLKPGKYMIEVIADPNHIYLEKYRDNNTYTQFFTVN